MAAFENWLEANTHEGIELRIDASNNDPSKKLIQGISGVAADLFDNYADQAYLMQSTGILSDLTEPALAHGFGPGTNWLGFASAVSWALFGLVFLMTLFNVKLGNRYVND